MYLWLALPRNYADAPIYDLPYIDSPTTGIGDPCRYYLGRSWRTPTKVDQHALIDLGHNSDIPLKITGYDLSFPATGIREVSDGKIDDSHLGQYHSSSISGAGIGNSSLRFFKIDTGGFTVYPLYYSTYGSGVPVRCVAK